MTQSSHFFELHMQLTLHSVSWKTLYRWTFPFIKACSSLLFNLKFPPRLEHRSRPFQPATDTTSYDK